MSGVGPLLCPILVGRDDLLARFDSLIADVRSGRGHTLFLSGQAGLGKTRLLQAAVRTGRAAGLRIHGGSVAPQDLEVPLASIREMATGMRGDETFGPLSERLLGLEVPHDGDALGARRAIVREMADGILSAIDFPTMLVFDDLHWADELSLEVIGELARHATGRPLLLVGGYRADEFPPEAIHREWRARLLSQRWGEEAQLSTLTLDETAIATTLILGRELPAPREVVAAVYERTNGIPLHIEELLAALEPDARTDGRRIRESYVPDTIGDAVLARVARLSDQTRMVAMAGAVIGRCFSPEALAGVVGTSTAELEEPLQELVDAAIVYPFNYIDHGYYDFRHQLLRDAVYGSVPAAALSRFHAQAAEFVMTLEASSIAHASRHYERAGLRSQAYAAALSAAQEANRISARHEAFELYQRAIANMPRDLPATEQAVLHEEFAGAAAAIERNDDCLLAAGRARALYLRAEQPLRAANMLLTMSVHPARTGTRREQVLANMEQALDEIAPLPDSPGRTRLLGQVLSARANEWLHAGQLDAARADALAARDRAGAIGDRETLLDVDVLLARIEIVAGRYEEGMRDALRAARAARDAGFESVGVTSYRNLALLAVRMMDRPTAELALAEGLQYADAIEQSHCRQMMAATRSMLDWAAGSWGAADGRARQELAERGCTRGVTGALDVIGLVAVGRGRLDEARRWLTESIDIGRRIGEVQLILTPLWGLAEADVQEGADDAAVERCEEAWSLASSAGERALLAPFIVTGARAYIAARRPDAAARWVARAREYFSGWAMAAPGLSHAEGLVRVASGSLSSGREALAGAVLGWTERGRAWEQMTATLDLARCLMRTNRHRDAVALVDEMRAKAVELESETLRARADELVRAFRARRVSVEPWRPLTVREFEVARLVADGLTNAEIAAGLTVSPKTVSAHVEHILAKLGVARRTEIAAWAARVQDAESPAAARARSRTRAGAREHSTDHAPSTA